MSNRESSALQQQRVVGQYTDQKTAEQAYAQLQTASFSSNQIVMETRQADPPLEKTQAIGGGKEGAVLGGVFGGLICLLFSLGIIYRLPGITPFIFVNPVVSIAGITLFGGFIGSIALGLIGALAGVNVPKETAPDLERLSTQYLIIVKGSEAEIQRASDTLQQHKQTESNLN